MSSLSLSPVITVNSNNTDFTSTASSKKRSILCVFALKAISLILLVVGIIPTLFAFRRDDSISAYSCLSRLAGISLYSIAHMVSTTEFTRKQNKIAKIILIPISIIFIAYGAHIFISIIGYPSEYKSLTFLPFPFGLLLLIGSTGYLKKHTDKIIKGLYLIVGIFSISIIIIFAAHGHSYFLEFTMDKLLFILFIVGSSLFLINIIMLLKEVRKFARKDLSNVVASDTQIETQGNNAYAYYGNNQANIPVNSQVSNYHQIVQSNVPRVPLLSENVNNYINQNNNQNESNVEYINFCTVHGNTQ